MVKIWVGLENSPKISKIDQKMAKKRPIAGVLIHQSTFFMWVCISVKK